MDQCATLRARPQRGRCAQGLEGSIVHPAGEANGQPQDGTVLAHLVEILSKEQLMTTITKKVSLHRRFAYSLAAADEASAIPGQRD